MHYYFLQSGWSTDNTLVAVSTLISLIAASLTMYVTLRINAFKLDVIAMLSKVEAKIEVKFTKFDSDIDKKFQTSDIKMEIRVKEIENKMVTRDSMALIQKNIDLSAENVALKLKESK